MCVMMTEIYTIEGCQYDVSSLEWTTLKNIYGKVNPEPQIQLLMLVIFSLIFPIF